MRTCSQTLGSGTCLSENGNPFVQGSNMSYFHFADCSGICTADSSCIGFSAALQVSIAPRPPP